MNEPFDKQLEIRFNAEPEERGYSQWHTQRRAAMEELARRLGLPLEHAVEVWLKNGIRLRGKLRLQEERLFIEPDRDFSLGLIVDNVPFTVDEIESCVRAD
ncbi:MAG: hypothetical protein M1608_02210 [Candidatus Omnitrophica bacterium]|nr:hypothetical protein [Candidatus Omnitrophota bacterium]